MTSFTIRNLLAAGMALMAFLPDTAFAQAYPNWPITVFPIFGPGSPQDAVIRALADLVSKDLKQPLIVDPKMGAAGAIGAAATATQKADGYTLGITVTPALSTTPLMQKLTYDPREFTYVIQLASFPLGIAIKAESPFKTWGDVVAAAKASPGKITYGTPGVGALANLGMLRIQGEAGISLTHVPHQNPMELIPAVLGDHVQLMAMGTEWKPNVEAGKLRLLMMFSDKRLPAFANTPILKEAGHNFELDVSFGVVAPKGVEPSIVQTLHDAFKRALENPAVTSMLQKFDIVPAYLDGAAFNARMAKIGQDYKPVIDKLGLSKKE